MMNEAGLRRVLPGQSSGSVHTFGTPRHPSVIDPILSKRVCFYKSGDPQFNGLRMVINNRTYKTFDALLDSLSKKVPLPFGVRNITTPHGIHAVSTLDDLEDGKSYICSDSRKVKPFNLARARKKLPPWYHARPATSRRRTVQKARMFPGRNNHKEPVALRTPKRLLVFRNGDPTVRHVVVVNKRSTPTFESMLEYISEQIQFHVVKLLTSEGKRVDGLPGLILCSGTVVAAGREPFKPANYSPENSPAQSTLTSNRKSIRRLKTLNRKNRSLSNPSNSRPFSPSSERYIVNQIHNSIAESSSELRSNLSNSVDWESANMLESVAETEGETCTGDGVEGQGGMMPSDDDIEKSFRVNQDGSMTVEMKVRLTLKEEETIQWTTTLTRSSVANQLNEDSLPLPEEEQISPPHSNSLDLQSPIASIDSVNKDKTKDNNDEDPPTPCSGAFREPSIEEDNTKVQTGLVSPKRVSTPGHKQIRTRQTSMESRTSVTAEGIQEGVVGSYSYREQTEHGAMTEQYCLVKQSSTRPVPKPRRLGSVDTSNQINVSTYTSAEMSEIMQVETSGEEVTETVLHIYEHQTCQDNFLANLCAKGMSSSEIPLCRPATSETAQFSSNNESEHELWRPSTASESINLWKAGSTSLTSDLTLPLLNTSASPEASTQRRLHKPGKDKSLQTGLKYDKMGSTKPRLNKNRRLVTPKKRQKPNSPEASDKCKKVKPFSSAGFLRKIYGGKSKTAKTKIKKGTAKSGAKVLTTKSSQQSDDTLESIPHDPETPPASNETTMETGQCRLDIAPLEVNQTRGVLTRQASMHQEKKIKNNAFDISKSISLPAFNSSSACTNEYVENWLDKSHFEHTAYPDEESKKTKEVVLVKTGNCTSRESENRNSLTIVADKVKCLENTSDAETCKTQKIDPPPANLLETSVKQRIQSFEIKSSPLLERKTLDQPIGRSPTITRHSENYSILAQRNTTPIDKTSQDMSPGSPVSITPQNPTSSGALSMDFPPPPSPPAETAELTNTECCEMDDSSEASSPLYRLSSVSSQISDNHPQSTSPASEKAASPTDLKMERSSSVGISIPLEETPFTRSPSIKRAPLVSNLSFGKTMALRRACMDKYALCSDDTSETASVNVPGDNLISTEIPRGKVQQSVSIMDLKSSQACCSSVSPTSLTSEEKVQLASISSGDHQMQKDLQFQEAKTTKESVLSNTEVSSPKCASSPSPERTSQTKKLPKLSPSHNHLPDNTTSPNIGRPNASPSTEKKQMPHYSTPQLQKRLSPYSQSLDVVTPPIRRRLSKKSLSRNQSTASDSSLEANRKTLAGKKKSQTHPSAKSTGEPEEKTSCNTTIPVEANQSSEVKRTEDLTTASQEKETQITPQPLEIPHHPDMKAMLEDICYSIKAIRLITQSKRPSCLERSNSLPDFSSHVASTFGSSSKALLAFLAVMTLKEGLTNHKVDELNANNVSCVEALKMIDSLKEIASIEDSHKLKDSLSNLQQSASKQLLQSWKGFQELSDKCKSHSSTPYDSEEELAETCSEKGGSIDETVIDELMNNLDMPEKLKEELACLSPSFKSDNDEKQKSCDKVTEEVEPSLNNDINPELSHVTPEGTIIVKDAVQDEKASVNVSSIIKQFTDQSNQSRMSSVEEPVKHKPLDQAAKESNSHCGDKEAAKSPTPEPEVTQLNIPELSVEDNTQGMESCNQGEEKQQDKNEDKSSEDASMNFINRDNKAEQDSCTSEAEEESHSEESICASENEPIYDIGLGPEQEGQNKSSANEDSGGGSSSETDEQHGSEEGAEVECDKTREKDNLSNQESCSEEEGSKRVSPSISVEEPSNKTALPNHTSYSYTERELNSKSDYMGVSVSVEDSACNSDIEEPTSEEEQHEVECDDTGDIAEEYFSNNEEEQESMFEEDLLEQTKVEEKVSLEEADYLADRGQVCENAKGQRTVRHLSSVIENQGIQRGDSSSSPNRYDCVAKQYQSSVDEDSGNDHNSCEENVEEEQPNEQIRSSNEEELSYFGKNSLEGHVIMEIYKEENCIKNQEILAFPVQDTCEKIAENPKNQPEKIISQSIAERVILLEKRVADAQKQANTAESPPKRRLSQRNVPPDPDTENSPKTQMSRSAPQSSLSFSYDSSGVITTEPESKKVRSIREMFLAKSTTDIPQLQRPPQTPKSSTLADFRAQTSTSAGYESQTSSELSGGEDDSARKSISKGFVRRTIERLYGMRNGNAEQEVSERPPSAQREKNKEHSSIFSPFHIAQSKAMPELSYFNSTSALDTLTEATRCIAFNAKVVPGHCDPINHEQLHLRENTQIRKSVSDPVGINKGFANSLERDSTCKDTEEGTSCSLPSKKSDLEDKEQSFSRKCTYFSLPHASDSDACQDDLSIVSKDSITDVKDNSEDTKISGEKNGTLPNVGVTDFKKMDNKVHPLVELPPDGEVVVLQPGKGQGVMHRRLQDPDMLDILYDFCGQNCPIL